MKTNPNDQCRGEDDLVDRRGPTQPKTCMICQVKDKNVIDIEYPGDSEFKFHWIHPKCLQRITGARSGCIP